jgi:hypothetical protein
MKKLTRTHKTLIAKAPKWTYRRPEIENITILPHDQAERERFERKAVVDKIYDGLAQTAMAENEAYRLRYC